MLSRILPAAIGSRVEIPNDESGLMGRIEAHGFSAEHVDERRIVLRRRATNERLRGVAVAERMKPLTADLEARIRILPC